MIYPTIVRGKNTKLLYMVRGKIGQTIFDATSVSYQRTLPYFVYLMVHPSTNFNSVIMEM